jgi:4-hydroxybenzoate polyprenyltransferase
MQLYDSGRLDTLRRLLGTALWWGQQLRVVQGAVAAAKVAFAATLLGVRTPLAVPIVALVAFGVYTANDLADIEEDAINCPDRSSFVADHPAFVALLTVGAFTVGGGLAWAAGGPPALAVAFVPLWAALCYSLPVPRGGRRLKDVFALNTALVAAAWAVTVTAVPLVLAGRPFGPVAAAVGLFFFLRSFVSVEVFNVRDVAGDAATGVRTLPVVLGIGPTRRVLALLDGCTLALLAALVTVPGTVRPAVLAVPVVGYSLVLTWLSGRTERTDALCLAKDCEYLLLGAVAVLVA